MIPYEITSTDTANHEIDLSNVAIFRDYSNDTVLTAFVKVFSGTFYLAVGESATGASKAFTSSENPVNPIPCSKENKLNWRTAATGASAVITFCP